MRIYSSALRAALFLPVWLSTGGCLINQINNHSPTSEVRIGSIVVKPRTTLSCAETIGEYVIIRVQKTLSRRRAIICKEYKIAVDEYEADRGNIRLWRNDSCGTDLFNILLQEYTALAIKRCLITLDVYDADDVRITVLMEEPESIKT